MTFAEFMKDAEKYLSKEDTFKIHPAAEFKDKYEMQKRIGNGAFAVVYLAKEKATGEFYAAKLIDRSQVSDPKHLWSEIHILYSLEHPSIIRLKDAYANKDHVMMILEYAKGGELLEHIYEAENYDETEANKIIKELLVAVDYLHQRKVVHRDIKPENILFLDEKASIMKLSDFGLSGILKENSLLSTCAGTPGFMAPEIIKNKGYGSECDIWSVGVLAYFLLSGVLPFNNKIPFKLYQSILEADFEYGEEFDVISEEAKDFINKCIIAEPKDRLKAKTALDHPWINPESTMMIKTRSLDGPKEKVPLPGVRAKVIDYLKERRSMKIYNAANKAISFISKLKMKAKLAKKQAAGKPEGEQTDTEGCGDVANSENPNEKKIE